MRKLFIAFFLLAFCQIVFSQTTMNNDAVIKMTKAGLSDDIVISTINASPGQYITSPDALIALKQSGVSDKVIAAIVNKVASAAAPAADAAPAASVQEPARSETAPAQAYKPRVYLQASSKGNNQNAARDQSMEMGKDFEQVCPGVRVTINQQAADYTVLLNHIEIGLFVRDNQFQIANKDGDLISKTKEGGSIMGGVKKACGIILEDWGKNNREAVPPSPDQAVNRN